MVPNPAHSTCSSTQQMGATDPPGVSSAFLAGVDVVCRRTWMCHRDNRSRIPLPLCILLPSFMLLRRPADRRGMDAEMAGDLGQ